MINIYKEELKNKIISLIIIIILLLGAMKFGNFISSLLLETEGSKNDTQGQQLTLKNILIDYPLFYITQYPKMIMELSSGEPPSYSPAPQQKPKREIKKEFIQIP